MEVRDNSMSSATKKHVMRNASYTANLLNQYEDREVPGFVNVIGTASNLATVTLWGDNGAFSPTSRKGDYFRGELAVTNTANPVWLTITNLAVLNNGSNPDIVTNATGRTFVPQTQELFYYDADGNLTNDGRWIYTWDAENRLVQQESLTAAPTGSKFKLEFVYDAKGRRLQKLVSTNNGSSYVAQYTNRFAYDRWNLIATLNPQLAILNSFGWGLDLSGSQQGAGGVGGLLLVRNVELSVTNFVAHDGNGNVAALVNVANGGVTAQYEYGPFGELLRVTGVSAKANPFRFSTKYQDDESDFLYYGYRSYNPSTGRWLSRDPIGEDGGFHLYGFVYNSSINRIDPKGLNSVLSIASGCAMSLLTKSIDKKIDQQFVCKELADRMRGVTEPRKGEQDAYDIDFCNGFHFQPYFPPGHHPQSLAKTLRNCILSGLKGKAAEKALEEVTDPGKRKILEELLNAASDPNVDARINVKVDVKCVNKKAQLTLNYSTAVSVNGRSATLETQSVGPFGCSMGTQLFGGKKFDDCCVDCDQDKTKQ
jgi:RHS repeat-associated protein